MSFGEYFNAFGSIGDAYREAFERADQKKWSQDAADLSSKQLDAYLAQQGAQPQIGLGMLGQSGAPVAAGGLSALGQASAPKLPSFAGGTAPMSLPAGGNKEIESQFVGALKDGGLTNPFGLAAAAAYAKRESGYSPNKITGAWSDPSESGQAGTSGGILSWRADRLDKMRAFTAGAKDPVTAQAKFFLTEDPNTTLALQNAKSPEEANDILAKAWKFAGYNRTGGGEYAARLGTTRAYVDRLAGLGASPSSGASPQIATTTPNGQLPPGASGLNPAFRPPAVARAMPQQPTQVASADPNFAPAPSMLGQPAPAEIGVGSNILNAPMQPNGAPPMAVPPARPPQTLIPQSMIGSGVSGTVLNRGNPVAQVGPSAAQPQQVASAQGGDGEADLPAPNAQPAGFQIPPGGAPTALPQQSVTAPDFVPGTVAAPAIQNGRAQDLPSVQGAPRMTPQQAQFLRAQLANPLTRAQAIQAIQGLNAPDKWETKELGGRVVQVNGRGDVRALPGFDKPEELTQFKAADGNDYLLNKRTGQTTRLIAGESKQFSDVTDPAQRQSAGVPDWYQGTVQRGPDGRIYYPGAGQQGVTPAQKTLNKQEQDVADDETKNVLEARNGATHAATKLQTLATLTDAWKRSNGSIYVGPGAETVLKAKQVAKNFGIDLGGVPESEIVSKVGTQLAAQTAKDLTSRPTQFDFAVMLQNNPGLMVSETGNRALINIGQQQAKHELQLAALARKWRPGQDWGAMRDEFEQKNPIVSPLTGKPLNPNELIDPSFAPPPSPGGGQGGRLQPLPPEMFNEAQTVLRTTKVPKAEIVKRLQSQGYDVSAFGQ